MLVFLSIVTGGLLFEHSKLDGTKKKIKKKDVRPLLRPLLKLEKNDGNGV